ncbi:endonuclease-reverse transcriptase [Elysia marginata]|uniref:Endonuclease-reverse transcriptase n=1 Tax=Elysia marginata TaxID=1093978 RepID=A0AAV4EI27_9GAST|nr:endonuclease-reverse transcriptase [Elysia marginata]
MEQYNLAAKEVKVSIKKDKESFTKTLAEKAEKAATAGHIKIVYQTTKTLVGKYTRSEMPVKDAGGKAIFEKDAQAARWIEHFTSLLNRPPPTNPPEILEARRDLPINCDTPSHREIVDAIKQLNQGKAAGPDLIPPEALKADVDTTATFLCPLFAKVCTSGKYPIDWKEGHLVKIPKKGDLSRCENYRGITLLSIPGKVFNRVLLNRIKSATDPKLRDEQAGFRSNRSTTDQIATLRIIVEQSLEWNSPLIVNFLDYEKAFDSIDRELLWKIMRNYGIPEKISVLLYGCEAWNASTMCIKRIQVFINWCLRRILRIKWTDKISNESLWERTRQIPAGDEIGRLRWRWIGHTLRKPCGSITKNVLD